MGKLAKLPFEIGRKYEIGHVFENPSPTSCKPEFKTNTQVFDIKNQHDLNLLNHHWKQLNDQAYCGNGVRLLPPFDVTYDEKKEALEDIISGIAMILKKDDVLSDKKIKEYTYKIANYLHTNTKQLKLEL